MTTISKFLFEEATKGAECSKFNHPWHPNCLQGNAMCYYQSTIGSAKFYAIVYLFQILMKGKKMLKSKEEWKKMGEYYARSVLLGVAVCGSINTMACMFRALHGQQKYVYYALLPSTISGAAIYLEPPARRGLVINLFFNLLLEYWINKAERAGHLVMSKWKQVLFFMMGSSALFYLMRLEGEKSERTPLFWLFTPEKVKRKIEDYDSPCPHKGSCEKHVLKGFAKLFAAGLGITLARVVLPKIKTPVRAISGLRWKHLKMGMFFGSYIGIYRAVVCYMCRKKGYDSPLYALPAGYLAGLSFAFNPSLGISIASVTAAMKLFSTVLYEKKILPTNIPLPELLYCYCQGTLFNARFMDPEVCPKYIFNLTKSVSNGGSEILYGTITEAVNKMLEK